MNLKHVFVFFSLQNVYRSISSVISGVVHGLNATVFAYGSTGRYAVM